MIAGGMTRGDLVPSTLRVLALLAMCGALVPWTTSDLGAHHSPVGIYRTGERAVIDGVLVSIVYRRPHSYLYLEDRSPDRRHMRVWAIESGESRWLRARVDEGALRPGDRIVVTGEPATDDGTLRVRLRRLVRPADGWGWEEGPR